MPVYFFETNDPGEAGAVGVELVGVEEARLEATHLCGDALRGMKTGLEPADGWRVAVRDEWGLLLFTLSCEVDELPSRRCG